jgi:hypothetical protein
MAVVFGWVPNGVARMAGRDSEMDRVAGKLYALALGKAQTHRLTGDYISKLKVKNVPGKKGVRDRMVIAGDKAAMSIEYGHAVRFNRGKDAAKNSYNFKWVPGQYILTGAINSIPGSRYNSFGDIL